MLRTDRSVGLLTGMIIAALYVILLVGFSRESYMRRDATSRVAMGDDVAPAEFTPADNVSKRVCRPGQPVCAALFADDKERQSCTASIDTLRQLVSETAIPATLQGLRRALQADR